MCKTEDFISDLKLGQYYEDKYIEKRNFKNVHHPKSRYFIDYDIKDLTTDVTYEVKADRKARGTKHLFVEFECSGKDSGINATKADYWIHFITEENIYESKKFIKIKVKKLIKKINKNRYEIRKGGKEYKARGFLVPIKDVEKYSEEN